MSESLCYDGYNQSAHTEVSMTLRSANGGGERNDACPKVVYGINPVMSGVMMETKPAEETAQTLRKSPGGENGVMTVGFKAGQSANGGLGDEREVSPTLSHQPSALEPTVAQSGVQCLTPSHPQTHRVYSEQGAFPSLCHNGGEAGQNQQAVLASLSQMRYIVRRLTPTECERLMGLPDGYTIPAGLDANDPALVAEFQRIHDTFGAIMAEYEHAKPPKPKTAAQVQKWLAKITDPATCPDSPRYKGCGNGWATNQPRWILTRLLNAEGIEW